MSAPGRPGADTALLDAARSAGASGDPVRLAEVGARHEGALAVDDRRGRGAFYTPGDVAAALVAATVERGPVVDPACGAGVFLLAAGNELVRHGADRRTVATTLLYGADTDPVAVAVTRAALAGWAGIDASEVRGVVEADVLLAGRSAWSTAPHGGFGAVVGNPPFLGQLRAGTWFTAGQREQLRERFGGLVGAYTDAAWLFLALGLDLLAPGGRCCLIQPQSLLAARDAAAVREVLLRDGSLVALWLDRSGVFGGRTIVCAPILQRGRTGGSEVTLLADRGVAPVDTVPPPAIGDGWGGLAAPLLGIPAVAPHADGTIGDLAAVTAGFRQHYYGLVDAVREDGGTSGRQLVTTGLVDPLRCRWGTAPARFAGRRWQRPVVDRERIGDPEVAAWVDARQVPKLLVASQTRVVEAMVDEEGDAVPVTPLIVVEPDPADLWRLAAVLSAPPVSSLAAAASAGAGRSTGRVRLIARQVAALPLPADGDAWSVGAEAARSICGQAGGAGEDLWLAFGEAMCRAYGVPADPLLDWWWSAHPARPARPGAKS